MRHLKTLAEPARKAEASRIARGLKPAQQDRNAEYTFSGFANELAAQGEWAVLEYLDEEVRRETDASEKLRDLYWALVRPNHPAPRVLLERLASEHMSDLILAPYRDGGLEELLRTVEDEEEPVADRVLASMRLGEMGDPSMIPRLRKWSSDSTDYRGWYSAGGPVGISGQPPLGTLGTYVRECIEAIEARARN